LGRVNFCLLPRLLARRRVDFIGLAEAMFDRRVADALCAIVGAAAKILPIAPAAASASAPALAAVAFA
jgi:hypothetical protein